MGSSHTSYEISEIYGQTAFLPACADRVLRQFVGLVKGTILIQVTTLNLNMDGSPNLYQKKMSFAPTYDDATGRFIIIVIIFFDLSSLPGKTFTTKRKRKPNECVDRNR